MSISYADMREIVAIQHKGDSHKEGEDLDQFIDCMTKIRMEQHTKIEDKVEALLNQLVFPDEMIVKMSKLLSPKKNKIKFNIKKVEEEKCEKCDIRLGKYEGTWEMKVEWCGKTMCGECALGKAERKGKEKEAIEAEAEKPKCNYCDSVSVIEWKEWGVWLCRRCAIHNNKHLKKIIDSYE